MDSVYWDDPNELVDRLRLLMASQAAGNPKNYIIQTLTVKVFTTMSIDIFGRPLDSDKSAQRGPAERGFNLTSDGNYNIENKRLCNLGNPSNKHDAATVQFVLRQMSELNKMIAEELHKPARRNYKRRHVDIRGLDETWQADLVEMIPYATVNNGYKYLLTIIDIFSKYAWAVPIKSKSGVDVTRAMKSVLQQGRVPKNLHIDQGKEFYNKEFKDLMKQHKINLYSTFSNLKASICERFNRTLKTKMWREFTAHGSYKWTDILDDLVNTYNNTKHSTIKMKPVDVTATQEKQLLKNIYQPLKTKSKQKFKVGDKVRISKYKHVFDKGYTPNWTTEIFTIKSVQNTNPTTYKLVDYQDQPIEGGFYNKELSKVKYPDVYLVEKHIFKKASFEVIKRDSLQG
ncbi:uncharacterized protein LOC141527612 [Cotesia typhae]|uniref:uncharacterized protein LOC141527612 n=1 Tax=Cotesia typhae TaxID=2053667 RepID=UPI003D69EA03